MNMDIFWGLFIPFLGTSLGAACVFLCGEKCIAAYSGAHRFCFRRHGGSLHLESSHSGH